MPRYKTAMCRNYTTRAGCSHGSKCNFAHGEHELRRASGTGSMQGGGHEDAAASSSSDAAWELEQQLQKAQQVQEARQAAQIAAANSRYANTTFEAARTSKFLTIYYLEDPAALRPLEFTGIAGLLVCICLCREQQRASHPTQADPRSMDAEKLSELFQGMEYSDDEDETLPEAFLCPITHVSACVCEREGRVCVRPFIECCCCAIPPASCCLASSHSPPALHLQPPLPAAVPPPGWCDRCRWLHLRTRCNRGMALKQRH
jgi:hypothetical protein